MTLQFSVFNVSHISKRLVEMKSEELGARIKWKAAAAALGGAAPGPKLLAVVDVALILRELKFQREQLQIDDETMKKHTEMFGPVFKEKLETGGRTEEEERKGLKVFLVEDMKGLTLLSAGLHVGTLA